MDHVEVEPVYCALCLTDVTSLQSLDSGRCRHVFCTRCISHLTEYEVVTCPYDLSAMLVSQLRPNIALMRQTAHLSHLHSCSQSDKRQCCLEMRKCVNLQGVPCKSAVFGSCKEVECPYEHSQQAVVSARAIVQKLAFHSQCQYVESEEVPEESETASGAPQAVSTTRRRSQRFSQSVCQWLVYLFDFIIVSWALFLIQISVYLLVLLLYYLEQLLHVTKFRVCGCAQTAVLAAAQCVRLPLLLGAWLLAKSVLVLRCVVAWRKKHSS